MEIIKVDVRLNHELLREAMMIMSLAGSLKPRSAPTLINLETNLEPDVEANLETDLESDVEIDLARPCPTLATLTNPVQPEMPLDNSPQ